MESPENRSSVRDRIKPEPVEPSPAAAFKYAFQQFAEARDYLRFYLRTRVEMFRLTIRNLLFIGVLSVTAVLLGAAMLVIAMVLLCRGVAEALTIAFGGKVWAGDLVTGVLLLSVVGVTMYGTIVTISHSWKKRTFTAFAEHKRLKSASSQRKLRPMSETTETVLPEAGLSEADFLRKQADQAQAAIAKALANAKAGLATGMDAREWTRAYPIVAVGSALAAGFVAAVMAIPSKEEQELARLAKLQKALHPEPPPQPRNNGDAKEPQPLWKTLLHEAVQLIRPVLGSLLFASLKGATTSPSDGHDYGTAAGDPNAHDNPAAR